MTLDPATLAALRARPHDFEAFRVLADRLQAEGDARGELITLQLHGLAAEVERHLALHARSLLGRLFTFQSALTLEWEAGFIRRATVRSGEGRQVRRWDGALLFEHRAKKPFAWLCEELLRLESAVLLEELTLELPPSPRRQQLFLGALEKVARVAPPTLHRVDLFPPAVDPLDEEAVFPDIVTRLVKTEDQMLTVSADSMALVERAQAVLCNPG